MGARRSHIRADEARLPRSRSWPPGSASAATTRASRKDRLTARNGSPYLSVELRDRTGSITGRAFREVDRLAARFERGDAIRVSGRVERFRGELVAEIDDIRALDGADLDPGAFLPSAYRDGDELAGFLEHLTREVHDPALREVVARVLFSEPVATEFKRAPCTRAGHHAYMGGLVEHTVAVGTLVGEVCQLHPRLDSDMLMAAALLHDVGKIARVHLRRRVRAHRGGPAARPPRDRRRDRRGGARRAARRAPRRAAPLRPLPPRRRRRRAAAGAGAAASAHPRRWRSTG